MPNLRISLAGRPLLDLASYARRGPGHRDRLSPEELAHIGRTVRRTPEVMVKVLSKDSNNLRSIARHLNYIGRRGELELESDHGDWLQGRKAGQRLVEDWDLDLDADRRDSPLTAGAGPAPKLVHKIMLSMPPGTPAKGVLEAVRNFAREEFALKHRYALVLHTDEPHPHVHLVVKAVSEQGERLNIRKATGVEAGIFSAPTRPRHCCKCHRARGAGREPDAQEGRDLSRCAAGGFDSHPRSQRGGSR
jgi:hypothetical protein